MTEEERKRIVRRIADFLHKYATEEQLQQIAVIINLPQEKSK